MITFIVIIGSVIALMIVGLSVNLYLYSRKALRVTDKEIEPEDAATQQRHLDEVLFQ